MAKRSSKSISERDMGKLIQVHQLPDIQAALDSIVHDVKTETSLVSFPEIVKTLRKQHLVRKYGPDLFSMFLRRLDITEGQWDRIEALTHKWASLYELPGARHLVQPLIQELCQFFGCRIRSFPHVHDNGSLWDFRLLFPEVHLNYFDDEIHLFFLPDSRSGPNEFSMVKDLIRKSDATSKITLLLVLGPAEELRELAKASTMEIVVLDEDDCLEILLSPDSRRTFCQSVARKVSVQTLQPYQTQGKVRTRMFYGRQEEIRRLRSNLTSSFAIYGGRLIGKSSLLHHIATEFSGDESRSYRVCSVTAQGLKSPVDTCRIILKELGIPTALHRSVHTFERLLRDDLNSHSKKILILLDEVDELVSLDRQSNDQVFEVFHNLNNDFGERCRFVFAGYRELAEQCMDRESRFRNFAETIRLGNLDPVNARLLVEQPLCAELGFRFDQDSFVDEILGFTGGHPNYIQVFCKELSEALERQQRRRIREYDIIDVFRSAEFRARVTETFYVNFSPIQQIVVSLVLVENLVEFSLSDAVNLLTEYGLDLDLAIVYKELRQLEMSFVLERDGPNYRFVNKLFPQILSESEDLAGLAVILLSRLNKTAA